MNIDMEIISHLFNNAALLLSLCLLYDTLISRRKGLAPAYSNMVAGLLAGTIGIAVMANPWILGDGYIFDSRSILLCVTGLFFGTVPTVVAMAMTSLYRLHLGGGGAAASGIFVIVASGAIGVYWHHRRRLALTDLSFGEIYLFGAVVHAVMMVILALPPKPLSMADVVRIGIPVFVIYPLVTAFLGLLMVNRHRHLRSERALSKSEERFALAMDATSDGLWDWEPVTDHCYFSPSFYRMLGYEPGEFPACSTAWSDLIHPDDRERTLQQKKKCIEHACDGFEMEYRMRTKDGDWKWILGRGKVVQTGTQDRSVRIIGTNVDITERKLAEESLRESERRYREVFDNTFDAIFLIEVTGDKQFRLIDINAAEERLLGTRTEEVRGRLLEEVIPTALAAQMSENYRRCIDAGAPVSYEESAELMHGTTYFYTTLVPIFDETGHIYRIIGISHDITSRKLSEEKVRASENLYHQLFDLESDAIFLIDGDNGNIIEANHTAESLYGFGRDMLLTLKNTDLSAEPEKTRSALQDKQKKIPVRLHRKKDGTVFPVEITASHFDWNGKDVHLVAIRDITERIQSEEERKQLMSQLSQSQKMEAIGQLAGGVAHDFNNILTVIFGYSHILMTKIEPDTPLRLPVEQILFSAGKAAELTQGLLAFSRKQVLATAPMDLVTVIKEMERMLRRLVREDVEFTVIAPDRDLYVNADKGQIGQVLINLVTNAVDAMPDGGTLTISADTFTMDDDFVRERGYGKHGVYATFSVTDTGCGMDEETARKIFEPFYTTKEVGKGTGLGLAIVYGIVSQHMGFVGLESKPGAGTTFRVFIPAIPADSLGETERDTKPLLSGPPGTETILLAEDDEELRHLNGTTLRDTGYQVLVARDGEEAVAVFREHCDDINLLILDVVMPKKNGKDVYEEIKKIRPDMKVLFTSGYTKDIITAKGINDNDMHFINKPFKIDEILKAVRDVLDLPETGVQILGKTLQP